MRCVNIEELGVVSGGGDPKGCYDAIMAGSKAGAGTGAFVGAVGGSSVPVIGTGAGAAILGAVGTLAGGAVAAANSPACQPTAAPAADSFLLNDVNSSSWTWSSYLGAYVDSFCDSGISASGCNYGMGDW